MKIASYTAGRKLTISQRVGSDKRVVSFCYVGKQQLFTGKHFYFLGATGGCLPSLIVAQCGTVEMEHKYNIREQQNSSILEKSSHFPGMTLTRPYNLYGARDVLQGHSR